MAGVSKAIPAERSADELTIHRRAIARAPVLPREVQFSLARRLRAERDAFVTAALGAPEVVRALLQRWQELRAAGHSTGILSIHHVDGASPELSAEIDRALGQVARYFAGAARSSVTAQRARVARALQAAELAVEAVVRAFRDSNATALGSTASAEHETAATAFSVYAATRDTLVRHNLRLVLRFARPFRAMNVPLGDLVQEGSLGLMRAVEKFDPERGLSFSTYAAWWIHQAMIRAVQRESRTVRVPSTVYEVQIRFRRTEEALRAVTASEPGRDDVAQVMGLSPEEADRVVASGRPIVSTHAPVAGSESLLFEDTLADEANRDPGEACDQRVLASAVPAMLAPLSQRERAVLAARFGLHGDDEATLTQVGARLGLSRERVRQIEAQALARIRKGPVARDLVTWRPAAAPAV